ncbi:MULTISPECIES: LapA family protein [Leisingera]|uniref:LapA family protein n=1 Tax=Leisingera TaxID=191028 RepID=UPI00041F9308|nr:MULTISPECIES: LapA family protein [Leisingera]
MTLRDPLAGKLRFHLSIMIGACIAGAAVITAFVMGFYSVRAILVCAAIGAILAWPAGTWATRKIKREDPAWDHRHDKPKDA